MTRPLFTYYLLQSSAGRIADAVIFLSYIKENTAINRRVGIKFANYSHTKSVLIQDTALLNQKIVSPVDHITGSNTGRKLILPGSYVTKTVMLERG